MRPPHDEIIGQTREEVRVVGHLEPDLPELRHIGRTERRAKMLAHELHAGTYTQHGKCRLIQVLVVVAHPVGVARHTGGSAGEDEAVEVLQFVERGGVRYDLGLDLEIFQYAPLTVGPLSAVVNDIYLHGR